MTSTAVSWALTLSLVGVGVYYYKPDLVTSITSSSTKSSSSHVEPAERPANKRTKSKKTQPSKVADSKDESTLSTSGEAKSSKKRKIATASGEAASLESGSGINTGSSSVHRDDADQADQEFAQQLAKTQAGTKLQKPEGQKYATKNKAPKQPQATNVESSALSTETSSTTGRDADDDLTPAESPSTRPNDGPSRAGDISDMLEAPTVKPSILRLSHIPDEPKPKKKAAAQPFEQVLTKKQRQAQAKKEELRQMKEESDRVHEAKKQEQLRTARMASGTSNQTKANNFASNTGNAWQSGKNNAAVKAPPSTSATPLLDTFEPSSRNVSQPHGAVHTESLSSVNANDATELKREVGTNKASTLTASTREGRQHGDHALSGNISEEEQMQMLQEQQAEDAWESVTSKKSKKKTKNDNDSGNETLDAYRPPTTVSRAQPNGTKSTNNQNRVEPETNNRFGSFQTIQSDSLADAEWEA